MSWIGLQVCHFSVQVTDNSILGLQFASRGSSGRRLHLQGSARVVVKELHPPESLQQAECGSGPFGHESCLSRTALVPVSMISCCVTKQLRPPVSNIQCRRVETSSQSRLTGPIEAITGGRSTSSPLSAPLYQYLGRLIVLLVAVVPMAGKVPLNVKLPAPTHRHPPIAAFGGVLELRPPFQAASARTGLVQVLLQFAISSTSLEPRERATHLRKVSTDERHAEIGPSPSDPASSRARQFIFLLRLTNKEPSRRTN